MAGTPTVGIDAGIRGDDVPSLDSDYPRYLATKRTVDDRAVNERVLRRLATELSGRDRLRVLNLGAGIGGAIERLIERDVFPADAEISCALVDVREANVRAARERLPEWARSQGYTVSELADDPDPDSAFDLDSDSDPGSDGDGRDGERDGGSPRIRIETETRGIDLRILVADAFSVIEEGEWDLLVGQAFLDLFDLDEALPALLTALAPGGYCYFPITFDGGTVFEPAIEAVPRDRLERAFHDHIDRNGGDPYAGRHLLTRLPRENAEVVAAGSSDWVIHGRDGTYPAEEATFLGFIVDTVADSLAEDRESDLASDALADWRERRHEAIETGELVYVAHQLDVLGRVPETDGSASG
jgi:hypothetical protein